MDSSCIDRFVEYLPDAVFITDPDGSISALNSRAVRLLNVEAEELLGKAFATIVFPEYRLNLKKMFLEGLVDGKAGKSEIRLIGLEGAPVDASMGVTSFRMEGREGYIIAVREIGCRIELERQRVIQHDLAVSLVGKQDLNEASELVLRAGMEISGFDGGFIFINNLEEEKWQLSAITNIDTKELESLHFEDELSRMPDKFRHWIFFGDDGDGSVLAPSASMQALGIRSAALIPVLSDGQTIALLSIFSSLPRRMDHEIRRSLEIVSSQFGSLVGRVLSESRFRSSEVFNRSLIRSMPSGLMVRNSEGIVTHFNIAAEELTGLKGSDVIGKRSFSEDLRFFNRDGAFIGHEKMPTFKILENGEPVRNMIVHAVRPDGSDLWLSVNGEPLFRSGTKPEAVVVTMKDISGHRLMVEELEKARTHAESASSSKSRFLANISHEIRTPLSGIMGMTDILLSGAVSEEQRDNLFLMKEAEESLLDIINKVLEISKIESGKVSLELEPFHLRGAVNKAALPVFMGCREKGIVLEIVVAPNVPDRLLGDGSRLTQVLTNFLSNALKFTETGTITLSVKKDGDREERTLELIFSVSDTGIGIPYNQQDTIFEDFMQIDSGPAKKHQGTGLGLAISKKLVELMGGSIEVESTPGRGSCFSFLIPFELPSADGEPPAEARGTSPFEGQLRVLVAEDNELNQRSISHFLQEAGHTVTVVENGLEAIDALEREPFDIVLMDVQMPEMDGMEATRNIRAHDRRLYNPEIPIIALTAYALKEDELRFITAGMDRFVTKPVEKELLFNAIHEMTSVYGASDSILFHSEPEKRESEELYQFLRDYQSDLDIAAQILELFIDEYPLKREKLKRAVRDNDSGTVVDMLHSLTNNLSALRVFGLGNECSLAEVVAKEGNLGEVNRRLTQLLPRLEQIHSNAVHCRRFLGNL